MRLARRKFSLIVQILRISAGRRAAPRDTLGAEERLVDDRENIRRPGR